VAAPVTVAVVSRDTRELLRECLASLEADAAEGRAAVWVVDNASSDGSAELVGDEFGWATLVASRENLGFGRAVRLVAARAPRTPWLAVANADVAPAPGALAKLVAAGEADPRAGAVAPRLVSPDGSPQHSVHPFPTLPFTVLFNLSLQRANARWADERCLEGYWNPQRGRTVPWAIGALLLVRRAAWHEVGGFDPGQWLYAEDLDLGWRLHRAGWHTRYEPAASARHAGAASTAAVWGDARDERWMAATYAWLRRRRGPAYARAVAAVNVAGALARPRWRRWARLHAIGLR